jgi:uncharacterized protein
MTSKDPSGDLPFWAKYLCQQQVSQRVEPHVLEDDLLANLSSNSFISNLHNQQESVMAVSIMNLESMLQNFVNQSSDIQGAALVSLDGLSLASCLASGMDEERVSAMSATMLSLGERICQELVRGDIERLFVEGKQGYAALVGCGEDSVLLVMASTSMKQGLLMLEIKRITAELKSALG